MEKTDRISYLIVGSGYRAEFYGRIARRYPELFRAAFLCRSEEKAALMRSRTGIVAVTSPEGGEAFRPDFAVIAVNKTSICSVAEEWVQRGFPVMTETPCGMTEEELKRLWTLHCQGARITTAEQYHRYPGLIAGLEAVREGRIGTPYFAYLSLVHDYHAASLFRRMLRTDGESFTLRGSRMKSPLTVTDSRNGAVYDGHQADEVRDTVIIDFDSGKRAVYDFSGSQYHSFLRSRHLVVRGDKGEWNDNLLYTWRDTQVRYPDKENPDSGGENPVACKKDPGAGKENPDSCEEKAAGFPVTECLLPFIPEKYRALDTPEMRDIRKVWRPELHLDNAQDEFAIASMLFDMINCLHGSKDVYLLREALADAYFRILMERAISRPWEEIRPDRMPWDSEE